MTLSLLRLPKLIRAASILALVLASSSFAQAEYYAFNTGKGADGTVMEIRWPTWSETTYNAIYSQYLQSSDGGSCYFYGGVTFASPTYPASGKTAGVIWSFWPPSGIAAGQAVKPSYTSASMWAPPHIGEGASGKAEGKWPLLQTGRWYRFAFRVWQPSDGTPHTAFAAQWMRDSETGNWFHLATMSIPFAATGITPLGGFLEDPSHGNRFPRRADFRNVYYHMPGTDDNAWPMANQFSPMTRAEQKGTSGLIENNTAAFFETCSGADYTNFNMGPGSQTVTLTMTNQPPTPAFDDIVVKNTSAVAMDRQLMVHWEMPQTSSPQFAYTIDVFDNPACIGKPVMTFSDRDPETRGKLLNIPAVNSPGVRLTITDIFNRLSQPIVIPVSKSPLAPAATVASTVDGLSYRYYELTVAKPADDRADSETTMPDFQALKPVAHGAVDGLDLTPRLRRNNYAFDYTGYLKVPADGLYQFTMRSCSGAIFTLDGKNVIDASKSHSPADASGWVALRAGLHAVDVRSFFAAPEHYANQFVDTLSLSYEGPGFARTPVPASAWSRVPEGREPVITLNTPANGAVLSSGNVTLDVTANAGSAAVKGVQFYVGDFYIGSSTTAPYSVKAVLGAGPNQALRARLVYNDNTTFDSHANVVTVNLPVLDPWHLWSIGDQTRPAGASVDGGRYSLSGDGLNLLGQRIDGDCTLIAHLADITSRTVSPDGIAAANEWAAGLMMRSDTEARPGSELGDGKSRYVAVFGSVGGDTHFQDVTMASLGGHHGSGDQGAASWFKLQRAGDTFTTSISPDGNQWTVANTATLPKMPPVLYTGFFTYAATSGNPLTHHATFDKVTLDGKQAPAEAKR